MSRAWVAAVALAGCSYDDSFRDCVITCAQDRGCPDGLACDREGFCRTDGETSSCRPPLLERYRDCPLAMFAPGTMAQELSDPAYSASWAGGWVMPVPRAGVLGFGPHPHTANWWENYSPTSSRFAAGDGLACALVRMTRQPGEDPSWNTFELTTRVGMDARFETAGLCLGVAANAGEVRLRTRVNDDLWTTFDVQPLAMEAGELSFVLLLYGRGDRFVAHVANGRTGAVATAHATATFAPGGRITMLGWYNGAGAYVDRLVIGAPAVELEAELDELLP